MRPVISILFISAMAYAQSGEAIYKQRCASCHEGGLDRAPSRAALSQMTAERVLTAMESGPMISMASGRSAADRRSIAEFVSGKKFSGTLVDTPPPEAMCASGPPPDFSDALFGPGGGGMLRIRGFRTPPTPGLRRIRCPGSK
jgi:cytochrome c553